VDKCFGSWAKKVNTSFHNARVLELLKTVLSGFLLCANAMASPDEILLLNEEVWFTWDGTQESNGGVAPWKAAHELDIKRLGEQWWTSTYGPDMSEYQNGEMHIRFIGVELPARKSSVTVGNYFKYNNTSVQHGGSGPRKLPPAGVIETWVSSTNDVHPTEPFNCICGKACPNLKCPDDYISNVSPDWRLLVRGFCSGGDRGDGSVADMKKRCPEEAMGFFPLTFHATYVLVKDGAVFSGWDQFPPTWGGGTQDQAAEAKQGAIEK
jgi:hypothetical protein